MNLSKKPLHVWAINQPEPIRTHSFTVVHNQDEILASLQFSDLHCQLDELGVEIVNGGVMARWEAMVP
ncbi:MAG: hypothetical protein AUJ20_11900 [Comamonadaceae bacterium CG1_02_60_18]|nr:MAG: hypothetical protein AUJ20_11900 [Comamonadaceae bacterium CG1_02_60_18]PIQ55550.1 MAG: hypothetical protein COW02_02925 [Comamonadaceae bacterium CG12_big_fil_rev_8_21_14_0_65_59_15]